MLCLPLLLELLLVSGSVSQHLPRQKAFLLCRLVYAAAHFLCAKSWKGGKVMDVITDIYRRSIQPSERSMRKDKTYMRLKNQADQQYKNLSGRLSQEELAILNKLISCYDKKAERKHAHCFKNGFKRGFAVAVKSLE